jgi:MFS transporter, FHS family, L-fucose permease
VSGSFFINYVVETGATSNDKVGAQYFARAQGAFAVGRFAGVLIMRFVKPRIVFLAFLTGCIIFLAPACGVTGHAGMAMLYMVLFFESICFPTIVALGMRGLGRHSKRGSGWIVAGVAGGACVPPLMGAVGDMHGDMGIAMTVPLAFLVVALSYPLAVNFAPRYKAVADAFTESKVGTSGAVDEEKAVVEGLESTKESVEVKNAIPTIQ